MIGGKDGSLRTHFLATNWEAVAETRVTVTNTLVIIVTDEAHKTRGAGTPVADCLVFCTGEELMDHCRDTKDEERVRKALELVHA